MKVYYRDYALESMPCANCRVRLAINSETGDVIFVQLVSYATLILEARLNDCRLEALVYAPVNYSPTTARHVNRFTTEMFGRNLYHVLKGTDGYIDGSDHGRFASFVRNYLDNGKRKF